MTREEKDQIIEELTDRFKENSNFYLTDISELSSNDTADLRKLCYDDDITLRVVKNTLIEKALEKASLTTEELRDLLKGPSALMFSESLNAPAKLLKKFREKHDKPTLKGAFVEENLYVGDDKIKQLAELKSREELIGDIVGLLQSPVKNVVSALQSGGSKISGILETLSEKAE